MAHANPIQIQKFLKGVDYPASKATLIENAKKMGADENICASLEQLPDENFQTPAEVSQAFKGPSSDQVESGVETGSNEFLVQAMQDSLAEIELCMLALQKSSNAEVKAFAQTMIDEHGRMGQDLERLAEKKKLTLTKAITDQHAAEVKKMSGLPAREFDRRFMEMNVKDHENDLKVFKHYAAEEKDDDIKALAEKGVHMFTRHLKMAKELDKKV